MGGFSLMDYFKFIADSTFVSNVNKGIIQTNDYFGTKTIQGMALNTGMLYNKSNNKINKTDVMIKIKNRMDDEERRKEEKQENARLIRETNLGQSA